MLTSLVFMAAYAAGLIAAFAVSGAWAFHTYQLVYFLNPHSRWWAEAVPSLPYSLITVIAMGLACMARRRDPGLAGVRDVAPLKWLIGVGLFLTIVTPFALNPIQHEIALIDFWKLIATVLIAFVLLDDERKLEIAYFAYFVGAFYIGWEAYSRGRNGKGRVEGIGMVDVPDGNGFSAALVPAIPLLIFFFWQGRTWQRVLACALGAFIANGIVLINSRGSFLGVVAGALWMLGTMLLSRHQRGRQRLIVVCIIALSSGAGLYVTDELFWKRMSTLQEIEDGGKSGSHRTEMWFAAIEVTKDHPTGVGAYGFHELSRFYIDAELFNKKGPKAVQKKAVHSMWFQALTELGWAGMTCFLLMLLSCAKSSRRVKRALIARGDFRGYFRAVALEGACLSYLVAGSFIDGFRSQMLYWMVLFIVVQQAVVLRETDAPGHAVAAKAGSGPGPGQSAPWWAGAHR